jgi:fucose permease
MATKTAILIFYLRIAKTTEVVLRIGSFVTLAIVNIAGVVLTFLNAFQCKPARAAFMPHIHGECMSVVTLYLCSAPVNVITDLAILVLPLPVLTGIHIPRKQKAILLFTFTLGIFVTILDVIRIYYLQKAIDTQRSMRKQEQVGNSTDFAWTASTALMWSAVEVNAGIICACIPTLRPLFQRILPSVITDKLSYKYATSSDLDSRPRSDPSHMGRGGPALDDHELGNQRYPTEEGDIGIMDFLTTPDMNPAEPSNQRLSLDTMQIQDTTNGFYFGFIDLNRPKSMLTTTGKESFKYCTMVTILFFLWGFSKGLLVTLVDQIKSLVHETVKQDIGLTASYSVGYFFGPLTVGQWVLRHGGFRATFITGLCVYGTGALMFWPSAVLTSYTGFIICQFVIGFGLSVLETAANPFLTLCGPPQFSEFRLLLAQGVQSTANVLSQVLSQKVLYAKISTNSLIDVQWTYLAITLFTVILALAFYYLPVPEASDAELQVLSEKLPIPGSQTFCSTKYPLIRITLALAVFSQFCYLGAQESLVIWQGLLRSAIYYRFNLKLSINDFGLISQTTFTIGRFLFAGLCLVIRPRFLLLSAFLFGTVFAALMMTIYHGPSSAAVTVVFSFFEGPIFPLIFAIGLRGMGTWTKYVGAVLLSSACSGAIFPYVMYIIVYDLHMPAHYAFCVVVALFAFGSIFPAYLTLVSKAGHQIDPTPMRGRREAVASSANKRARHAGRIRQLNRKVNAMIFKIFGVHQERRDSELRIVTNGESGEIPRTLDRDANR